MMRKVNKKLVVSLACLGTGALGYGLYSHYQVSLVEHLSILAGWFGVGVKIELVAAFNRTESLFCKLLPSRPSGSADCPLVSNKSKCFRKRTMNMMFSLLAAVQLEPVLLSMLRVVAWRRPWLRNMTSLQEPAADRPSSFTAVSGIFKRPSCNSTSNK